MSTPIQFRKLTKERFEALHAAVLEARAQLEACDIEELALRRQLRENEAQAARLQTAYEAAVYEFKEELGVDIYLGVQK